MLTLLIFPKFYLKFLQVKYLPLWMMVTYILVQGLLLNNTSSSIKETIQLLWVCACIVIASTYTQWDSKLFFKWLLIFLAISAAFTILVHFSQGQFTRYKLASDGKYAFGLLSVLLLLGAEQLKSRKHYILFFISLIPLFMSMERKGILGVLLIIIILWCVKLIKSKPLLKGVPYIILISSLVFLPYLMNVAGEFLTEKIYSNYFIDEKLTYYTSNMHRENLLINSYHIINDNFFLGIGADNITEYMQRFYFDKRLGNGAHNFYVDNLVKYGLIGSLILFGIPLVHFLSNKFSNAFSNNLILFNCYCLFVITFMADGQAVLLIYLFSFLNPYLFINND
ncbi:O-antigen ligase family protein [Paraglaciecola sp.]|uniref:O-antigen ligase family protein n=1 Tax=Paraglaciecola sp. TaxID=1920173 RepID=UPI003262F6A7